MLSTSTDLGHKDKNVVARAVFDGLRCKGGFSVSGNFPFVEMSITKKRQLQIVKINVFDYIRGIETEDGQLVFVPWYAEAWGKSERITNKILSRQDGTVTIEYEAGFIRGKFTIKSAKIKRN